MRAELDHLQLRLIWDDAITGAHYDNVHTLPIAIGRASSLNTIVLDNKQVSRQHACLLNVDGQIVIFDQDSTNGTYVEGERVKRATLGVGDRFRIGPFTFTCANQPSTG